jgi:rhodanese-related sulfurtransferase
MGAVEAGDESIYALQERWEDVEDLDNLELTSVRSGRSTSSLSSSSSSSLSSTGGAPTVVTHHRTQSLEVSVPPSDNEHFLLLDVRDDEDQVKKLRIQGATHYPPPLLRRDHFTPQMYKFVREQPHTGAGRQKLAGCSWPQACITASSLCSEKMVGSQLVSSHPLPLALLLLIATFSLLSPLRLSLPQRNKADKLIILYDTDDTSRTAMECAVLFLQKGFDNIFVLTGGLKHFSEKYVDRIEGSEASKIRAKVKAAAEAAAQGGHGRTGSVSNRSQALAGTPAPRGMGATGRLGASSSRPLTGASNSSSVMSSRPMGGVGTSLGATSFVGGARGRTGRESPRDALGRSQQAQRGATASSSAATSTSQIGARPFR